jgi:hypothetical protein
LLYGVSPPENGYIDYEEYIAFLKLYKKDPELEKLELREAFRYVH